MISSFILFIFGVRFFPLEGVGSLNCYSQVLHHFISLRATKPRTAQVLNCQKMCSDRNVILNDAVAEQKIRKILNLLPEVLPISFSFSFSRKKKERRAYSIKDCRSKNHWTAGRPLLRFSYHFCQIM